MVAILINQSTTFAHCHRNPRSKSNGYASSFKTVEILLFIGSTSKFT